MKRNVKLNEEIKSLKQMQQVKRATDGQLGTFFGCGVKKTDFGEFVTVTIKIDGAFIDLTAEQFSAMFSWN